MVYHSKKDAWLVLVIILGFATCFVTGLFVLISGPDRTVGWIVFGAGLAIGVLIFWLSYPLFYEISDSRLLVRSGALRWDIPLANINEVHPTNNPLSSPAMSLDRLSISYEAQGERKSLLISPENKSGFIHELASVAPHLQVSGDGLKRKLR